MFEDYVETLNTWHVEAMVRSRAPIRLSREALDSCHLFSPALLPVGAHPAVAALGPQARTKLEAWQLMEYLTKTERVELDIVNEAVRAIIAGLPELPATLRLDAFKVYTDEGYHVIMMQETVSSLEEALDFDTTVPAPAAIERILALLPERSRSLGVILSAIVTETLITASLRQVSDSRLVPEVTSLLSDHARDEAKHHAFFTRLARCYLPQMSGAELELAEHVVPEVLFAFLDPNLPGVCRNLMRLGLDAATAEEIVIQAYDAEALKASMRESSRATRAIFDKAGLALSEAFEARLSGFTVNAA